MTTPYIVKSGDTLTTIARTHGLASRREIYYASENENFRQRRPNPDRIFPGDTLVIPNRSCGITPQTDVEPPPASIEKRIVSGRPFQGQALNLRGARPPAIGAHGRYETSPPGARLQGSGAKRKLRDRAC
jgi:hypothetical protein